MWCKPIGVALIAGGSATCFPLLAAAQSEIASPAGTAHADQQSGRSLLLAQHRPGPLNPRSSIMQEAATGRKQVSLMFAEATGSFLVLLEIAREQALFEKLGIDVRAVPASGATVPRLSEEVPLGLIGAPAALLQVAEGADLRLTATLSTTNLSGHLVARPGIKTAQDLRGKRLGVRVIGAGIWISTVLALEQLGLDPKRDDIILVPVGSPAQILRALEQGEIDGALTSVAQSRDLESRGFSVLLRRLPRRCHELRWCFGSATRIRGGQCRCNRKRNNRPHRGARVCSSRTKQTRGHASLQERTQHHRGHYRSTEPA